MLKYIREPDSYLQTPAGTIACFVSNNGNSDKNVIRSFGEEWKKFSRFTDEELQSVGRQYFDIIDERMINKNTVVLDAGCGSGRWSKYISDRVKFIEAIDASDAVASAKTFLRDLENIRITRASLNALPFEDESFDFIMSIGVLHHVPDTEEGIRNLVTKLKPGGYLFLYLYYNMENRGMVYRMLYHTSDFFRRAISSLPSLVKAWLCEAIAVLLYLPFVFLTKLTKAFFPKSNLYQRIPLSYYSDKSFRVIRNDALDRFGTSLENRFSKEQIEQMAKNSDVSEVVFSKNPPYWHFVGRKLN